MRHWLRRYREASRGRREVAELQTTAAPAPRLAESTSHGLRDNPIEPDPNPKKRQLIKSSSAASCSGQQRVKRSATDAEPAAPIGVPMDMGTDESAALQLAH